MKGETFPALSPMVARQRLWEHLGRKEMFMPAWVVLALTSTVTGSAPQVRALSY